jgi:hypothetical protein
MNTAIERLIMRVADDPTSVLMIRQPQNYGAFLGLYEDVGFAPAIPTRDNWRSQCRHSWEMIDELLPGTTTGGTDSGNLVSSLGTLPVSSTVLYTHSACMVRTLPAAVALLAQALRSLTWFDRLPEMQWLSMGYSYSSRFTTLFQRPSGFTIPGQIEIESLLCIPVADFARQLNSDVYLTDIPAENYDLSPEQSFVVDSLGESHPRLAGYHSTKRLTVLSRGSPKVLAVLLVQESAPFLTAADVHREVQVFPTTTSVCLERLIRGLRNIPELRNRSLYLFLPPGSVIPGEIEGEVLGVSFWIATPRRQLSLLSRSYLQAFATIFRKYSVADLNRYPSRHNEV